MDRKAGFRKRALSFLLAALCLVGFASAASPKESLLYQFSGSSDGAMPMASMTADKAGNLFGTTNAGGGSANCASGCGTVFELSQRGGAWTETVIYSFQGGNDGANPQAPMIVDSAGNLYGSASEGGDGNCGNIGLTGCGTIFELVPPGRAGAPWTEKVLYTFQGVPGGKGSGDAAWPNALVFDGSHNLYGLAYSGGHCTTDETGTYCNGAAFRLKKSSQSGWSEKVTYRFRGATGAPAGPVLDTAGNLYGTAAGGAYGFGTVFRLQPEHGAWTESSLYDFQGGNDGAFPLPGLIFDSSGNLYSASLGTGYGYSNVFELSPERNGRWSERVLYAFKKTEKGYLPAVGPILGDDGHLYGTTESGGKSDRGTVYELTPPGKARQSWKESVLYSFDGGAGGFAPDGGLNPGKGGALYGTTVAGGDTSCDSGNGCGIVFRVKP